MSELVSDHSDGSTGKKVLFIHIPKCAGVSMAEALSKNSQVLRIGPHSKYRDIFEPRGAMNRDEYFVFSFVRNPWDRLVSTFFYILKGGRADIDKRRRELYLEKYNGDFGRFVRDIENWFSIEEDESIYPDKYIPHFRPQCEFICDDNGRVAVNFIGRVENIKNDFKQLCDILSVGKVKLRRTNKSSHRAYHKYYDDETREIVTEYYRQDIETLGYSFNSKKSVWPQFLAG